MTKLKTGDFVEIQYTGTITETQQVFDTTNVEVAKKEKIHNEKMKYEPITICIGQNQILPGIDKALIGKDEGKTFKLSLEAEKAFGKKNAKLIKLLPSNVFKKQGINIFVGLEVQIDGLPGIVRSTSSGRVLVDFNHPLAGRDLEYNITIGKIVKDVKKKINSYLDLAFGVTNPKIEVTQGKATIEMQQLPAEISNAVVSKIREIIPEIKTIEFVAKK